MQEQRRSKPASCAVAPRSTSGISPGNLNTASQPYASSVKTGCFILGKGDNKHESKMRIMRTRTQPGSSGLQRLLRAGEMLFVQFHAVMESAVVCQGKTWHRMLRTGGLRWTRGSELVWCAVNARGSQPVHTSMPQHERFSLTKCEVVFAQAERRPRLNKKSFRLGVL
jgi:hypothetical protein